MQEFAKKMTMRNNKNMEKKSKRLQGIWGNFVENTSMGIRVIIVLFIIMSILIVVLAVMVNMQKQEEAPGIPIVNFQEISNAPEEYQANTEQLIWILASKSELIPEDVTAVIREGSYSEEINNKTVSAKFIVDIEELRYSFEVTMSWLKSQKKYEDLYVKIQCPYYTDVIYPDTKCVAEQPTEQIKRYLPHNYYLDDGKLVHVEESGAGRNYRLLVKVEACKNQDVIEAAMNHTTEWIKSLYMDPEDFATEPYDTCMMK